MEVLALPFTKVTLPLRNSVVTRRLYILSYIILRFIYGWQISAFVWISQRLRLLDDKTHKVHTPNGVVVM